MENLTMNEIREKYLVFFESKNHLRMKSFSLVPENDKSLLLVNSGMAPLKPYFTGQKIPLNKRVTSCQKCIRTGDIENVGMTARHGTFFEMLGNFSFGDYFKEEAIVWGWEFVTEILKLPKEKLYVTTFLDDDEAYELWNKKIGLTPDRIFKMGREDNFWEVGLGPCGPCSEMFYDKGAEFGCGSPDCTVGCECDRYMEFWNLVFTQFNKEDDGTYTKLKHPNIDTGMGLERMATIMQNVNSIFDIDTMKAIMDKICDISNKKYGDNEEMDISLRVVTDHIRSVAFMTSDGILPSNEGRGYVLRRLLRRAVRHGKLLGIDHPFMTEVCKVVIEIFKSEYTELFEKRDYILKIISIEEERFRETLNQGMELLQTIISTKKNISNMVLGEDAFKLYDTFGFPLELMREILKEENMDVDEEGFNREMNAQKERARTARSESNFMGSSETIYNKIDTSLSSKFIGYSNLEAKDLNIIGLIKTNELVSSITENDEIGIVLDKTSFYAESGGQKGDIGKIISPSGEIEIYDTIMVAGDKIAHLGKVTKGKIESTEKVKTIVNKENRMDTARNHTATHLLHKALKEILGNHVEQAGSLVSNSHLRFDFTHFEPISPKEIDEIEDIVNKRILESLSVTVFEKPIAEARGMGATALFGEKYGDIVRVVQVENYSTELCGGTHITNTSQVGLFKIISETGIAAGVRRIEALTGSGALNYFKSLNTKIKNISALLKSTPENLFERIEFFMNETKKLNDQIDNLRSKLISDTLDDLVKEAQEINDFKFLVSEIKNTDLDILRKTGDKLKDKIKSGIIVLFTKKDNKVNVITMATDDAVSKGAHAGQIIKELSEIIGGKGGGRPNMAQGGGSNYENIDKAILKAEEIIRKQLL